LRKGRKREKGRAIIQSKRPMIKSIFFMKNIKLMKNIRLPFISAVALFLLLSLGATIIMAEEDTSEDTNLAAELKKEVEKSHGFKLKVYVVTNPESKLQDIYILPESGQDIETETFIYAILNAVNYLTTEIIAYRIYIGVVLIDINGELFAISAKNAREVISSKPEEERSTKLNTYLKKLR
jgi:hypothetical protein